jgi:hypothetical protein
VANKDHRLLQDQHNEKCIYYNGPPISSGDGSPSYCTKIQRWLNTDISLCVDCSVAEYGDKIK